MAHLNFISQSDLMVYLMHHAQMTRVGCQYFYELYQVAFVFVGCFVYLDFSCLFSIVSYFLPSNTGRSSIALNRFVFSFFWNVKIKRKETKNKQTQKRLSGKWMEKKNCKNFCACSKLKTKILPNFVVAVALAFLLSVLKFNWLFSFFFFFIIFAFV